MDREERPSERKAIDYHASTSNCLRLYHLPLKKSDSVVTANAAQNTDVIFRDRRMSMIQWCRQSPRPHGHRFLYLFEDRRYVNGHHITCDIWQRRCRTVDGAGSRRQRSSRTTGGAGSRRQRSSRTTGGAGSRRQRSSRTTGGASFAK